MHIQEGDIRAYVDRELEPEKAAMLESHLAECPLCLEKYQAFQGRQQLLSNVFESINITETNPLIQTPVAWRTLQSKINEDQKEKTNMWKNMQFRIPRLAWMAMAIVLILAVSLTFAPVRAIANNFLGLFRVEQIQVVEVDYRNLSSQLGDSSQIENFLSENVQVAEGGDTQEVADAQTAAQMTGLDVRVISGFDGPVKFRVQPAAKAVFNMDLELIEAILKDLNRSDIQLPDSIDGAVVTVEIPTAVISSYGDCPEPDGETEAGAYDPDDPDISRMADRPDCIGFLQVPAPTISAPPDLDVNQIGQAYLQILGMKPKEAQKFAQNVDWTSTFIVPIPNSGTDYMEVSVDGVKGTLITHHSGQFILIWLKDGILHALSGPGAKNRALELAGALR